MPVGAGRGHQLGNAVDQLQWGEHQFTRVFVGLQRLVVITQKIDFFAQPLKHDFSLHTAFGAARAGAHQHMSGVGSHRISFKAFAAAQRD